MPPQQLDQFAPSTLSSGEHKRRKLNRYTKASLIATAVVVLMTIVLSALLFFVAMQAEDPEHDPFVNAILIVEVLSWFIFFILTIYLSLKTLSTINKTEEVGKTFAWIGLVVSTILALWTGFWMLFAASWLLTSEPVNNLAPISVAPSQSVETATSTDTSAYETESLEPVPSGTKTGYIVSINANELVIDYVDVLYGEKAFEAMVRDGYCAKEVSIDECFNSVPLYDRNANPNLRTFKMSPTVSILSDRREKLTTDEITKNLLAFKIPPSEYSVEKFPNSYHGHLFEITFNSKSEVERIEGIFRP